MRGSFTRRGRRCEVTVTKTHFKGTVKSSLGPNQQWTFSVDDVLAVQMQSRGNSDVSSVVVHYVTQGNAQSLTWSKLVLTGEPELCKELTNSLNSTLPERLKAKHFLVVINPVGGGKSASRLFHKKVAPLLRTCNITFKVYETRSADDTPNAFNDVDFSELDGVLSVGGDGHFSKVLRALMETNCARLGVRHDCTGNEGESRLPPLPFPVGVIPGGTGNYVANYLGCKDPITAAIKIVLGHTVPTNMAAVHQGGKLEGYGGLICAYGLIGDMIHSCEQARWLGPLRYTVMPIKRLFSRRLMDVDVCMRQESGEWTTVSQQLYSVDTGVVELQDSGHNLVPVFGDSALTLHLTSHCSLGDHVKQLGKVQNWATGAYNFDFVKSFRCLEYRVTKRSPSTSNSRSQSIDEPPSSQSTVNPPSSQSTVNPPSSQTSQAPSASRNCNFYLNLDGEALLIHENSFTVRLHTGVVSLFGNQREN